MQNCHNLILHRCFLVLSRELPASSAPLMHELSGGTSSQLVDIPTAGAHKPPMHEGPEENALFGLAG